MNPSSGPWSSGAAYESYVGRWSRLVAARFVPGLAVRAGAAWIDVGCGTGVLTAAVLEHSEPSSVLGVDASAAFVATAAERIQDPRARFEVGDAAALPVGDAATDAVVSGLVLNFLPDRPAALAEWRRVLRPGGVLGLYVWDYAGDMQLMRHLWDAAVELDPAAADLDEGRRSAFCRPEPLRLLAETAGFDEVQVDAVDVPTVFRDLDDYWTRSSPAPDRRRPTSAVCPLTRGSGSTTCWPPGCRAPPTARSRCAHEPGRCALDDLVDMATAHRERTTRRLLLSTGKGPVHSSADHVPQLRRAAEGRRQAGTGSAGAGTGVTPRRTTVFETTITVVGNVVDSPRKVRLKDNQVTNFRVAATPRRFDSAAQRYVDGTTFFVDVECWGDLSGHVAGSVSQGDPVVVVGAISTDSWETDTGRRSKPKIRARAVGHNMHWGISKFTKLTRAPAPADAEPTEAGSPVDPSDEEFGEAVDQLTGEILRGRDYVTDSGALHTLTADDLTAEPAQA